MLFVPLTLIPLTRPCQKRSDKPRKGRGIIVRGIRRTAQFRNSVFTRLRIKARISALVAADSAVGSGAANEVAAQKIAALTSRTNLWLPSRFTMMAHPRTYPHPGENQALLPAILEW